MNELMEQTRAAMEQLLALSSLKPGQLFVVGCSTSEVLGEKIGTHSNFDTASLLFETIYAILNDKGIFLAAQCCEHLNRALILEEEAVLRRGYPAVNVVPQPKAGGSFATAAYQAFKKPVAVESIQADAGMDIGGTLIGMHLKPVAVPVRLSVKQIGCANILCARTRPKFIGGSRAAYDQTIL